MSSLMQRDPELSVHANLRRQVEAASRSHVPTLITLGAAHKLHFVNAAFARFVGTSAAALEGRLAEDVCREFERLDALIGRAWSRRASELAPDLAYAGRDGVTLYAATLAHPIEGLLELAAVVQVIDTTLSAYGQSESARNEHDLKQANEQLLLAGIREHDLAERAAQATRVVEGLLHRKSVLAEASALLSTSLDLEHTLSIVTHLPLPELADGCVLALFSELAGERLEVAHIEPEKEAALSLQRDQLVRDPDFEALRTSVRQSGAPQILDVLLPASRGGLQGALPRVLQGIGVQTAIAVPISARNRVVGMLLLLDGSSRHRLTPQHVDFGLELARRASVAIDNARLYHEAKQAARMREDVLAIVSHDMRNPLSAITMCVERLLKHVPEHDPLELGESYAVIHRSSKHIRRLIEELLEVASIQSAQLSLELKPQRVDSMFGEALEMLRPIAGQKGILLEQLAYEPGLVARCDAERFVRVVANLVGNAIKFTPRGGRVVVASGREGELLRVDVIDSGVGIAPSEQPRLFEQYWKGQQTGRTGMGLGLYIARGIVEAHGGRIWVESSEAGSTFSFTMPLASL